MNQSKQLRDLVATMLMLSGNEVRAESSLRSLNSSLGGAKLKLGLKRLGWILPEGPLPMTMGELEAVLLSKRPDDTGTVAPPGEPPPNILASVISPGVQIGLDLQDVRSLPLADDYWEHAFYCDTFGGSEIAYAVIQAEPRSHFAGFWCAKEALRKCDHSFQRVEMRSTVVTHDASGRPYLALQRQDSNVRLPHAVSISHTSDLAMAIVMIAETLPAGARAFQCEGQ